MNDSNYLPNIGMLWAEVWNQSELTSDKESEGVHFADRCGSES
jgi:hypothetical protein